MTRHSGQHPRFGAMDVCPLVPVSGITMEETVELARELGRRLGEEAGLSVYLYEEAATRPERRNLAQVRAGEYEGLAERMKDPAHAPDFGPTEFQPRTGATAVSARNFLAAFNVNLNTTSTRRASPRRSFSCRSFSGSRVTTASSSCQNGEWRTHRI